MTFPLPSPSHSSSSLPSIPSPLLSFPPPLHPLCSFPVFLVTPLLHASVHVQIHTQKCTRGNTLAHTHIKTHTHEQQRRTQTHANAHTLTHTRPGGEHGGGGPEKSPTTAQDRPKPRRPFVYISVGFPRSHPHTPSRGFHLGRAFGINGGEAARSSPSRHVLLLLLLGLAPSTIHSFGVLAGTKKRLAVPPRPSTSLGALPQAHSPHRAAAKPTETLAWPRAEAESSRTRPVAPDLHQARVALRGDPRALPRAMGGPPPPRRRTVFQKGFPHKRTHWRLLRSAASSPPLAKGKRKALLARPKLTALLA